MTAACSYSLIGEQTTRLALEWGRIQSNVDWVLPALVLAALAVFTAVMYVRERRTIGLLIATSLAALRIVAAMGLLVLYAEPQWRTERLVTRNSRVVLLADTSRSMARADVSSGSTVTTRSEQLAAELAGGPLVEQLRRRHDVIVARFDEQSDKLVTLAKFPSSGEGENDASPHTAEPAQPPEVLRGLRLAAAVSLGLCALCLVSYPVVWLVRRDAPPPWPWAVFTVACLLSAGGTLAWMDLNNPRTPLAVLLGFSEAVEDGSSGDANPHSDHQPVDSSEIIEQQPAAVDWQTALAPRGNETRLGEALRKWIHAEQNGPLAGIVVLTDGGQNAGVQPAAAVEVARETGAKLYTVGLGSSRRPVNVAVTGVVAPARAYPGDAFFVDALVQADGLAGTPLTVELLSKDFRDRDKPGEGPSLGLQRITLGEDGRVLPVKFRVENKTADGEPATGRKLLTVKLHPPGGDAEPLDNQRQAVVQIVDRKSRLLLLAGGPTRDYRFLRNLLHRGDDTVVDVLLQTARPGTVQDAQRVLDEFPVSPTELSEYDAIVAFDFDWRQLDQEQVDLLDHWVAAEAGGLIAVAGPVFTSRWVNDPDTAARMSKVRALYPVQFKKSFSSLVDVDDDRFQRDQPHPVEFTREGLDAQFLWLDETAPASQQAWSSFAGVFGYFAVSGPKQAATVYGYFDDPRASLEVGQPVYLAEQFYGAGRVFYLGSGELWRLRAVDNAYFERLYTKLIRHVSQGRLLRGSKHGVLTVSRDETVVGKTVDVHCHLTDARNQPLKIPSVPLVIVQPGGTPETILLGRDPTRDGAYSGQFTPRLEGLYRLDLSVPDAPEEILSRAVDAKFPDLERQHGVLDEELLRRIASQTGGEYFASLADARGDGPARSLASELDDRTQTSYEPGALDALWERKWMRWMMMLICGALSLEWLTRRLLKLA